MKQLADERRAKGLSTLELADRVGYAQNFLQKLECGHRHPSFAMLNAWATVLDCELVLQRKSKP